MNFWPFTYSFLNLKEYIPNETKLKLIGFLSFYFQSHKKVSRRKQADFGRWHSKWLKSNVSDTSQTSINEWFMGKCDGLVPNKTYKIEYNNLEITSFRTFFKYMVVLKTSSNGHTLTSSISEQNASGVLVERMNPGSEYNKDSAKTKKRKLN